MRLRRFRFRQIGYRLHNIGTQRADLRPDPGRGHPADQISAWPRRIMTVSPRIADRIPRYGHERPNRPNSYGLRDGRPETPNPRGLAGSRPEVPKPEKRSWVNSPACVVSGSCTRRAGACACSVKYLKNRHRVAPLCRTPCTVCGGSPEARVFWAFQPGQRWDPRQLDICGQAPRKPLFHAGFHMGFGLARPPLHTVSASHNHLPL